MGCLLAGPLGNAKCFGDLSRQQQGADFRVSDIESHVRSIKGAGRDGVAFVRVGQCLGGTARIRRNLRERPAHFSTDDGNIFQRKASRHLYGCVRLVRREPVDRQEGIDVGPRTGGMLATPRQ